MDLRHRAIPPIFFPSAASNKPWESKSLSGWLLPERGSVIRRLQNCSLLVFFMMVSRLGVQDGGF
jgi:hypothetical protein